MLQRRVVSMLIAAGATAWFVGCGGDADHSSNAQIIATSPGSTTSGPVTSADGAFRTIVPRGFTYSPPAKTPPGGTAVEYVASAASADVFESISVTRRPLGSEAQDAAAAAIVRSLGHAPGVGQTTPLTRAASPTGAQSWQFRSAPPGAAPEIVEQTFIARGKSLYIVMATAPASHLAALKKSVTSVLADWRWT